MLTDLPSLLLRSPARGTLGLLLAAALIGLTPAPGPAAEPRGRGLVVPVPNVITSEATNRLRTAVYGPLRRYEAERQLDPAGVGEFHLICDFNAAGRDNASEDFGACLSLATAIDDLRKKQNVHVVAYLHGKVTRHAVLPVLACSEIIFSNDPPATLGKVASADRPLRDVERFGYESIAGQRYPRVLIRKMYDPAVSVLKSPRGERYRDANEKPPPQGEPVADLGPGDTALYTFAQARELGLCQAVARNTLDEVRDRYDLPRASLYQPLDHINAWRIKVEGPINAEMQEKVQRRIRRALGNKANLLIVQLACGDGDANIAHELGLYLATLNDNRQDNPVETVAWVTSQAHNTAAFLALGCNKIVMQRQARQGDEVVHPGAHLGDFDHYLQEHPELEKTLPRRLAEVAARQHYPPLLAEGLAGRELRIVAVESSKGESARKFISEEDWKEDQRGGEQRWKKLADIKPARGSDENKTLNLSAEQARELGLCDLAASYEEVCEMEGVAPAEVRLSDTDWLDQLADFLRDPWTSVVLVMLGITCLILELKMPGVGLPGIVAAVCFLLFFWSHSQLNGQITWLAFLLFLLGLLLIGLEVFVLPGFGVAGISGIVLVLGSLGLVAYGHWPRSNEEWIGFGQKIGPFGISILGALAVAFTVARYLPSIPWANRLMLRPGDEHSENPDEVVAAAQAELTSLLGAIGVAATPLRPAGKAQFGDDFVDVVAEGSYVVPGTRVQVIEIEGNRIVVKEV
jgi:membrane-bound ClpP family serine protease